ncbi:MAG: hypothetical protein ACRCYQ_06635 [Nocardioides sp.]
MIAFGIVLLIAGALAVSAAAFVSKGSGEILGFELTTLTIFLLGLATGLAAHWGVSFIRLGARRSMKERKDRKQMEELSDKLQKVEAERKKEAEADDR